jgi:hypothetical protein
MEESGEIGGAPKMDAKMLIIESRTAAIARIAIIFIPPYVDKIADFSININSGRMSL